MTLAPPRPSDADRPYRAFGYPVVLALYVVGATTILVVLLGVPVYCMWRRTA